jgi:MoxR-like ATPase
MKQKILALLNELNHGLVEREQTLKTALLTVLAGENLVLIGPPGTGKSLIARRIAESFAHENDNSYFEYLLTKFSTPEEIFGLLSISELKADRFKRNTVGYLPSVKIAFLDEIFKASSSILNALLTILNERLYHNGATAQKVPLQALIAASNELPTDQEELNALYDRFLVRSFVDYVREENLLRLFEHTEEPNVQTPITADDLAHIKNAVQTVTIPPEIAEAIQTIWIAHKDSFKEDRREYLSDRRLKKVLHLLRVSAVTNGRNELDLSDVLLLKDCLWNHQENALKVRELILKTLQRYSRQVIHSRARLAPTDVGAALSRETKKTGQLNAKERGYKGLGTAEDPILIENVQDLMGLDGIGQKGYTFLQTADIDCTAITTWQDINLV